MSLVPYFLQIDDDLARSGELVSVEAFRQVAEGLNYLIDSMPIGSIIPVLVGMPGVPEPDPALWKLCDNTQITNQLSSLHDHAAPDMRNRYLKGADTPGVAGQVAGTNVRNFAHSHGGVTNNNDIGGDNSDTDDDFITIYSHAHPISTDLNQNYNVEPLHFRVLHYIKIA